MNRTLWIALALLTLAGCRSGRLPHEGQNVHQLKRLLDDPDPIVQARGALGLSLHGPAAAPAIPRLIELLSSPKPLVRQQSALALGKAGSDEAVPALVKALDDPAWPVRRMAALALGDLGPVARSARGALEKRLADEQGPVRKAAGQALERLR